jgi:hypothetical protein
MDYLIVVCMVLGLAIFMHADANSSAVFQPAGVIMLVRSLSLLLIYWFDVADKSAFPRRCP